MDRRVLSKVGLLLLVSLAAGIANGADLKIVLPQGRTAFQTNEWIDISVVRSAREALTAAQLILTLKGRDGSSVSATFAVPAVPLQGGEARGTDHFHVNGWMLRPGAYTVEAALDATRVSAELEVFSHVRQSSFRLVNWGRAVGKDQLLQGEDSFGFNLFYGNYATDDEANFIRAGVDFMANCVMSGGHQMDLRPECDWSDPYVTRGGTMRAVRRAMIDRMRPNVPGVHFYDEPGLTWGRDPANGEFTPHAVMAQHRSYNAAFGRLPLSYRDVNPNAPEQVAAWKHWATWKLGFLDAAWRDAQFGVSWVRPDFLSVTQSQYGWSAFTDGYYFNVARSLPVVSGHGGYHDFGPGYFNPSYFLEMARARDYDKPCWYLPTWYGNTTSDQYRLEQYLAFQTGIQGLIAPPDLEPAVNDSARQGIVESNQLMKRLGPIFTTAPATKPPVAMLYSLSQAIHTQTYDRTKSYAHAMPQGKNMPLTYLAGRLIQQPFLTVLDEDVLDGTLAADHRAVVLTSVDFLAPAVTTALEDFARRGGLVLLTGDCTVTISGAVKLSVTPRMPDQERIDELSSAGRWGDLGPYTTTAKYIQGAMPLAEAIRAELAKANMASVVQCNVPAIIVTRHAMGDVEYLLAVNATPDDSDPAQRILPRAVTATIKLPGDGRPIYNAVIGTPETGFASQGSEVVGEFRFGPGQMRVWARSARPIGGIQAAVPVVTHHLVRDVAPIQVEMSAVVVDDHGTLLSGSIPLHIRVLDSLGAVRWELYEATQQGHWAARLPLAANDPPGQWTVEIRELLSGAEVRTPFAYQPPSAVRSIAGATSRAVFAPGDRDNVFRFGRLFQDVTIVTGTSPFNEPAATRLMQSLEPWGIRCHKMELAKASAARPISEDEARTWVGLDFGAVRPGNDNPPGQAGFAVSGPVILIGNPADHPMIEFLARQRFLPYAAIGADFPGVGRGLVAWQRDGIGRGQESIVLIAYDETGMAEAVGSCYEAVAGIDPLTKWVWPDDHSIASATATTSRMKPPRLIWTALVPDRVLAFGVENHRLTTWSNDGSSFTFDDKGQSLASQYLSAADLGRAVKQSAAPEDPRCTSALAASARSDRRAKLAAATSDRVAIAYWGGSLRVVDTNNAIVSEQMMPQDITALTWFNGVLMAGLADGRILALSCE